MGSLPVLPTKATCHFKKENGELCKRNVDPRERMCWQHAVTWRNKWKSLTRNQALQFCLGLVLTIMFGAPGVYFSYAGWHDPRVPKPIAERLQATYDNLNVAPIPLSSQDRSDQIAVAITNGGHWDIGEHKFSCDLSSLWTGHNVFMEQDVMGGPSTELLGLLGGGRGETVGCHPRVSVQGPITCVDMEVVVTFALVEQPKDTMSKTYRFSTKYSPEGLTWIQQSLNSPQRGCM
jgi:hypothetical protein